MGRRAHRGLLRRRGARRDLVDPRSRRALEAAPSGAVFFWAIRRRVSCRRAFGIYRSALQLGLDDELARSLPPGLGLDAAASSRLARAARPVSRGSCSVVFIPGACRVIRWPRSSGLDELPRYSLELRDPRIVSWGSSSAIRRARAVKSGSVSCCHHRGPLFVIRDRRSGQLVELAIGLGRASSILPARAVDRGPWLAACMSSAKIGRPGQGGRGQKNGGLRKGKG